MEAKRDLLDMTDPVNQAREAQNVEEWRRIGQLRWQGVPEWLIFRPRRGAYYADIAAWLRANPHVRENA